MWWLIPIGIGVGKLVYDYFSNQEIEARKRWENKRKEVRRTVEEHQHNIEIHIQEVKSSYDFKLLTDIHYSSFIVANSAYKLLDDARTSLNAIGKIILKTKSEKNELLAKIKQVKTKEEKKELIENLKLINELRTDLFNDKDKVKLQRDEFYNEVKRLNQQTNELKIFIKERCGRKGTDWFNRLEERIRIKRIPEREF